MTAISEQEMHDDFAYQEADKSYSSLDFSFAYHAPGPGFNFFSTPDSSDDDDSVVVLLGEKKRKIGELEVKKEKVVVNCTEIAPGASLYCFKFSDLQLGSLHADLQAQRPSEYQRFTLYGKVIQHPRRLQAYLQGYRFSNVHHAPASFTPLSLLASMQHIEAVCADQQALAETTFNGALVNWYANGHEYIAKHSDDESELVAPTTVATLSLGQQRTLRIRRKSDNAIVKDVLLTHGSVYVMHGRNFQSDYTHEVPKVSGKKGAALGERISVSLRNHCNR